MTHTKIDLSLFTKPNLLVMADYQTGKQMREYFKLDELDKQKESFPIYIPDHIYSITSCLWRYFLGASAKHFKSSKDFYQHYPIITTHKDLKKYLIQSSQHWFE